MENKLSTIKILIGKLADLVYPALLIAFTLPLLILSIVNLIAGYGSAKEPIIKAITVVENAKNKAFNWWRSDGQKIVTVIKKVSES